VKGRVEVEKGRHHTHDILVGNITSPRALVFAHYDSIGPGVIDNASGVAVMLALLTQEAELLQEVLFVFSANEEYRINHFLDVAWVELSVRIDIDEDIRAVLERAFSCGAEHDAEPSIAIVRNDDISTTLVGFFDGTVDRSVVDYLDEYLVDTSKCSWYPMNRLRDLGFLVVSRHVYDELHRCVITDCY
jgi:hypothetical protein